MAKQFTFKKILFQNSASILTSHNQIRNLVVPLGGTEGARCWPSQPGHSLFFSPSSQYSLFSHHAKLRDVHSLEIVVQ